MAKLPKKPKPKKLPKKPKASAPYSSWEKYDAKVTEIHKDNAHKLSEWKKKCAHIKSSHSKKEALIKKHAH